MQTSRRFTHTLLWLGLLTLSAASGFAQGTAFPAAAPTSDNKPGSVLLYSYYSSNPSFPTAENTRIAVTNTNSSQSATLHVFFIDGASCAPADTFICLTQNQTMTFLLSDYDPGVTGYLLMVAVDRDTGVPTQFNYLIGDYSIKLASGHQANLTAQAFSALSATPSQMSPDGITAVIKFDDVNYNAGPRLLAIDSLPSRAEANDTMIVLNRLGGDLASGTAAPLSSFLGVLYDDVEKGYSFTLPVSGCQWRRSLSDTTPRTVPRYTTVIKNGRTGWMKLWPVENMAVVGVVLNFNPNTATNEHAFTGGHNMHILGTTTTDSYTIPIFTPSC